MTTPHASQHKSVTDDIDLLLDILPPDIREWLERHNEIENLLEIICDLGRAPEARYPGKSQVMPVSFGHTRGSRVRHASGGSLWQG